MARALEPEPWLILTLAFCRAEVVSWLFKLSFASAALAQKDEEQFSLENRLKKVKLQHNRVFRLALSKVPSFKSTILKRYGNVLHSELI